MKKLIVGSAFILGLASSSMAINILVYDNGNQHTYAQTAAGMLGTTTVGNSSTFNGLLTSSTWDLVFVDCPSTDTSWTDLTNYVNAGGRAVMSYWQYQSDMVMTNAFGASAVSSMSWNGQTLFDHSGGSFFSGVTMPNSDWHDHWGQDGVIFNTHSGTSLAGFSATAGVDSTMICANDGRTIAMGVIDEAGDNWNGDGSAVNIWKRAGEKVLNPVPEPMTMAALGLGILGLARRRRQAK